MKIRNIFIGLLISAGFIFTFSLLHAQQSATPVQGGAFSLATAANQDVSGLSDFEVELKALELLPTMPASQLPRETHGFYSVQHPDWPPMPGDVLGLNIWPMGDGLFAVDDRDVNYVEIQTAAEEQEAKEAKLKKRSPSGGGVEAMFSLISGSGGTPVYLTNIVATPTNGSMTVTFSIAGGTNGFAYDIFSTTNLLDSPVYSQWTWLGQGYTTNTYTFANQPPDYAFYILAIPRQTMVVAWGDDASGQCDVPSGLTNAIDVEGGYNFSLALKADGTVVAWGDNSSNECNVPVGLTNVTSIAAGGDFALALLQNGTVVAWGGNAKGQTNVPSGLANVTAIAAGDAYSMALRNDGTIVAWGDNTYGQTNVPAMGPVTQIAAGFFHGVALLTNSTVASWGIVVPGVNITNVPAGLSNVVSIAAGGYHSLALKADGTVAAWGAGSTNTSFENYGQSVVPAGLSNVVTVAGGGYFSMALQSDGTVEEWGADGYGESDVPDRLTGVKAISGGGFHSLVVRSGSFAPLILEEPEDQYALAGATVTFSSEGEGVAGVTYQWQFNGVNITGATSASLTLTNVQTTDDGSYQVIISNDAGYVTSDVATFTLITPPVITSQTLPTNVICIEGNYLSFAATATAPGQFDGYPLTYQWKLDGTNLPGETTTSYSFAASSSGVYSLVASNAAGSVSASWQVTLTNIDVTKDLLLIYNTNSLDSSNVCAYYLAHRPMVSGANVLGIGCTTNETFLPDEYTNVFAAQVQAWLAANPTKRPQYVILFYDIPSRVNTNNTPGVYAYDLSGGPYYPYPQRASVQYQLSTSCAAGWYPFVTSINMGSTNDCIAYINKLAFIGTNYSSGNLLISASVGGYANTNYCLDDTENGYGGDPFAMAAEQSLIQDGISSNAIVYTNVNPDCGSLACHITSRSNVAGYCSWGFHSSLGTYYATDGAVQWIGNSSWYIIETVESFNGQRTINCGNFIQWFSSNAFGATNYKNTPVGAVTQVDEPYLGGVNDSGTYFGLWAEGKNFGICAWNSRNTEYFQAVGDPFVIN